ncbi:hypothetical protein [Lacinutrix sp. 5H-3-7-4]|uniref:hypothetical protein n=1 Tax=Lacinutrix sp. (strain 5H-3-7-4) TaxID=983544 RepID=UPI00020A3311|nr:hypothetical protein [Lacinutrix sp. 5H-3-7-4]AEH00650.1 hypothetical protein Lacal_0801 [Lacinutrix sp. 5H-3-7-4]
MRFKLRYKRKANTIALIYTSVLQIAIVFLLGCFFAAFFNQMNYNAISSDKVWVLFIIAAIIIHVKNWLKYNGKTRKIMNAKFTKKKAPNHNFGLLIALPFICFVLAIVFLQAL